MSILIFIAGYYGFQFALEHFGEQGAYILMAVLIGMIIAGLREKNRHF